MGDHYDTLQQNASFQEKQWTDTVQFTESINENKPLFMEMMKQYKSMWDENHGQITAGKHRIDSSLLDAPPIHSAPYRVGSQQGKLEREQLNKIQKEGVTKLAITERSSPIIFVPKTDGYLSFVSTIVALILLHNAIDTYLKDG